MKRQSTVSSAELFVFKQKKSPISLFENKTGEAGDYDQKNVFRMFFYYQDVTFFWGLPVNNL